MTFAPGYVPQYAAPKNGLGTTALVLGIVGTLFAMIPLVGVIAWPMVILGLIFGLIGIQRVRSGSATNKGVTIAGTVLSGVGLALCIVWAAAFGATVATTPAPQVGSFPTMPDVANVAPVVPAPAPVAPAPGTIPGSGTFMVGSDIEPGTYKTGGPESFGCYYARLKDTTGDFGSIINNNVSQGPATVTIKASDGAFETSGCQTWTKAD